MTAEKALAISEECKGQIELGNQLAVQVLLEDIEKKIYKAATQGLREITDIFGGFRMLQPPPEQKTLLIKNLRERGFKVTSREIFMTPDQICVSW